MSLSLLASACSHASQTRSEASPQMLSVNEIRVVAPALEKYTQDRLLGEVWNRPGLVPRDRSIVTLAALISRNETIDMPYYLTLALDNGVKPREISEIITHLASYAGWPNARSAVAVAKDVFAPAQDRQRSAPAGFTTASSPRRGRRGTTRLARRRAVRLGGAGRRAVHHRRALPRPVAASGSCAPRPQSRHRQRAHRIGAGCAAALAPQSGDGQRPDAGAGRRSDPAPGLLRRLAQRLLGAPGRKARLREAPQ